MINKTISIGNAKLVSYVVSNTVEVEESRKRPTILICPGGGYGFVSEREAEPVALCYNAAGMNAFVLYYSIAPAKFPTALTEAALAMAYIRENAEEYNVDADKVVICGFSAGGHLAASLSVYWQETFLSELTGKLNESMKPNASILCYPVISWGEHAHKGSFINLLGDGLSDEEYKAQSLEFKVTKQTPRSFIWHTFEDQPVPVKNSMLYCEALLMHNIPFEYHVFPRGPHGLSLANEIVSKGDWGIVPEIQQWMPMSIRFIQNLKPIQ